MISDADFDQLCRRLYRQLEDGAVDPEAAFDLACAVLDGCPLAEGAASLARLCVADAADPAQLMRATRLVLAQSSRLGFAEEPGWLATLEQALEVVKRDMRACGLPGTGHLFVQEGGNAFVEVWGHHTGHAGGCSPADGSDPVWALVAVADDAQDAVMHAVWGAWPVCPAHGLGTHARGAEAAAVWWCQGGGGHVAAPIGQWRA